MTKRDLKKILNSKRTAAVLILLVAIGIFIPWDRVFSPGGLIHKTDVVVTQPREELITARNTHTYGIAAGSSLSSLSQNVLEERLDEVVATKSSWVRFDIEWANIQPNNKSQFEWEKYDRVVAAARARKLEVLGIITYTPKWARAANCDAGIGCAPVDINQYAEFAETVARRYAPQGVMTWEIWNEPNNAQYFSPVKPALYASLLKEASLRIKGAVPDAFIITGGLSPQATDGKNYAPIDFLRGVYTAGVKDSFDAVGNHPYTFPLTPVDSQPTAWYLMSKGPDNMRKIMVDNGDVAKKIWFTEFGAPTGGPGDTATLKSDKAKKNVWHVDDALQAKMASDAISEYVSYDWAGPFFWYSLRDAGTDKSTNENFFGLLRANGTKKPAYTVFEKAATN